MKLCLSFLFLLHTRYTIEDDISAVDGSAVEVENIRDIQYFERALNSPYFIDRTDLLEKLIKQEATLITAPRYFCKTTNLDMARRFFEMHFDDRGEQIYRKSTSAYSLFTNKSLNLHITKNRAFVEQHQGQYPVLYFTFSGVTGSTYQEIITSLCQRVRDAFLPYRWLHRVMEQWHLEGRRYPETKRRLNAYTLVVENKTEVWEIDPGIFALLEHIKKYFNKPAMVLVDDYDAPMLQAINSGVDAENVNFFMRSVLSNCVRSCVQASNTIVLGVSRIFKQDEMLLDRWSPFYYQYFLDDRGGCSKYFGFTEAEVDRLLDIKAVQPEERVKIKKYYNGYFIRKTNTSLYNPKGVLQYLETNAIDTVHETPPLIHSIMKCARHKAFFQEIIQLLINKKLRRILKHHTPRNLLGDFADIVKNDCVKPKGNITDDYIFPFYDCGYVTNTSDTYEYEVGRDWIVETIYRIPNKMIEDDLLFEFVQYYQNVYNITIVNSNLHSNIHSIASSSTTSEAMLAILAEILFELIKPKVDARLEEFEFQNIIYGALFLNANFKPDVRLRNYETSEEAWFDDFDKAKIISDDGKILTLVKIAFKKKETLECKDEIMNFVPFEPPHQSQWDLVKYLIINLKGTARIDVKEGESRKKW